MTEIAVMGSPQFTLGFRLAGVRRILDATSEDDLERAARTAFGDSTISILVLELGPGLLPSIYDGIQRPLEVLQEQMGHFILRGVDVPGLDHEKKWDFTPTVKKGDKVAPGQFIGTVQESPSILHKVMVPPNV